MLQLLGKSSSINVRKVLWACVEMDIACGQEEYGAGFRSTGTPEFLALNPNGLVPVIRDGDLVLWESNTICRYLAMKQGRTDLLPGDAAGRAQVEKWMDWQATDLNNSWRYAFLSLVRKSPAHQDAQALGEGVANWNRHMRMLEGRLQLTGAYAAGAAFTLADVVLGVSVNRWLVTPMKQPALPAVAAYHERLRERAGFRMHGCNGMP